MVTPLSYPSALTLTLAYRNCIVFSRQDFGIDKNLSERILDIDMLTPVGSNVSHNLITELIKTGTHCLYRCRCRVGVITGVSAGVSMCSTGVVYRCGGYMYQV